MGSGIQEMRYLIINADDFGIGPEVSRAILELASSRAITSAVLLTNSPFAESAVDAWRCAGMPVELGWHPTLTLDRPVSPAREVPSLVRPDGQFHSLGQFISRLYRGLNCLQEIRRELQAQHDRFVQWTGHAPTLVNCHHHISLFPPVGAILREILAQQNPHPYVRRVVEPWPQLLGTSKARRKRALLSLLGRWEAGWLAREGFPGNEWLAGISSPECVDSGDYLSEWISRMPGQVVELACHPGYMDDTLIGRDSNGHDGQLELRVHIHRLMREVSFLERCSDAGFILVSPSELPRDTGWNATA